MKKRGFGTQEIVERLHEKGIEVKAPTLAKYLSEFRRQREGRKAPKRDTPPPQRPKTAIQPQTSQHDSTVYGYGTGFLINGQAIKDGGKSTCRY